MKKYILFLAPGIALVATAPYFPDFLFRLILLYDFRYSDIRFLQVIPAIRLVGVMVFVIGIVKMIKEDEKNEKAHKMACNMYDNHFMHCHAGECGGN